MKTAAISEARSTSTMPYPVHITYTDGADEENELHVTGYPPENLQIGQEIEFIAKPAGLMVLVFTHGSNFSDQVPDVVESDATGRVTKIVTRLMTAEQLTNLQEPEDGVATSESVAPNAFPFKCYLGGKFDNRLSTKKGGFPAPPAAEH